MKRKVVAFSLILALLLILVACGGSKDEFAGKWTGSDSDGGEVTWTFDGKGGCKFESAFGIKSDGTYTASGDKFTVDLELWEDPAVYTYTLDGSSLVLIAEAHYGHDFDLTK